MVFKSSFDTAFNTEFPTISQMWPYQNRRAFLARVCAKVPFHDYQFAKRLLRAGREFADAGWKSFWSRAPFPKNAGRTIAYDR